MARNKKIYLGIGTSLIGIFIILQLFGLVITSDGDKFCDDICESIITVKNPTASTVEVFNTNKSYISFSKELKKYELYEWNVKTNKWTLVNFNKKTAVLTFPKYSTKTFKLLGYKQNPKDTIKWSFGELDPVWNPIDENNKSNFVTLKSNTNYCLNACKTEYNLINPTKFKFCDNNFNLTFVNADKLVSYNKGIEKLRNVTKEVINGNYYNYTVIVENGSYVEERFNITSIINITKEEKYVELINNSICIEPYSNTTLVITGAIKYGISVDNIICYRNFCFPEYAPWNSTMENITNGAVDYWSMDIADATTVYSDLGKTNFTNKLTTNTTGQIDSARYFPGASYLLSPFNFSTQYTFDFWFNATSGLTPDYNRRIISTQNESLGGAVNGLCIMYNVLTDLLKIYHNNGATANCGNFSSVEDVPLQHIAVNWNGSHVLCYLNGSLKTAVAYTTSVTDSGILMIGTNWPSVNNFLNKSVVDEVKIWNRSLNADEIASIHTLELNGTKFNYSAPITTTVATVTTPELSPGTIKRFIDLTAITNYTDSGANAGNVTFKLFINDTLNSTISNESVANGTNATATFSGGLFYKTDKLRIEVSAYNGNSYSNYENSSEVTVENTAPMIESVFIDPDTIFSVTNITVYTMYYDNDSDLGTINFSLYLDDNYNRSMLNESVTNGTNVTGYFSSDYSGGNVIIIGGNANDGTDDSGQTNSTPITVDSLPINISLVSPIDKYQTIQLVHNLSCNISGYNLKNVSFAVNESGNMAFVNTTTISTDGIYNYTFTFTDLSTPFNVTWNCFAESIDNSSWGTNRTIEIDTRTVTWQNSNITNLYYRINATNQATDLQSISIDLNDYFQTNTGTPVYSFNNLPDELLVISDSGILKITADADWTGQATIYITATNGFSTANSNNFTIFVFNNDTCANLTVYNGTAYTKNYVPIYRPLSRVTTAVKAGTQDASNSIYRIQNTCPLTQHKLIVKLDSADCSGITRKCSSDNVYLNSQTITTSYSNYLYDVVLDNYVSLWCWIDVNNPSCGTLTNVTTELLYG